MLKTNIFSMKPIDPAPYWMMRLFAIEKPVSKNHNRKSFESFESVDPSEYCKFQ